MSYYRYTRLQQYINGQPTDTYTKGERADNVDYSTYGACMGSSAVTQWVSIPQTICYNGDLWSMEKEQISYDGGISWADTGNTRRASVIEQSSSQCVMSEWRVVPGEYICMMYAKWPKEAEYISNDGGQTWTATGTIRRGETVIELLSPDCGVIYQWIPTGEYICQGYNKYMKEKQVYSTDNGSTWTDTGNRRTGGLVEVDSPYCGYEQYIYQWVDVAGEYVCQGYDKYTKQKEQRSSDMGVSWEDTGNTRAGEYIESLSTDCGVLYQWVTIPNDTICVGYDLYSREKQQYSTDNSTTWVDTGNTRTGSVIEQDSYDCGYDPSIVPLTLVSPTGISNLEFRHSGDVSSFEISYKYEDSDTWTRSTSDISINVPANKRVYFKGSFTTTGSIGTFYASSGNISVRGNVMSLIYNDNFLNQTSLAGKNYIFKKLFAMFRGYIADADKLSLPATTLSEGCYYMMFDNGWGLTKIPALPATTLTDYCYTSMFSGCDHLLNVPTDLLPATTMAAHCYEYMFAHCDRLLNPPALPATTLAESCYSTMFRECMDLVTAPELPATTLAPSCYYQMFFNCYDLTVAPVLFAPTLVYRCYMEMFYNCTHLIDVTCCAKDISATQCIVGWLGNVASTGTFHKDASTTWTAGTNGIPSGWTVVNCDCNPNTSKYLTTEALGDGNISLKKHTNSGYDSKEPLTDIQYSKNDGAWTSYTYGTNISVVTGDKVRWKATLNDGNSTDYYSHFYATADYKVYGNPLSVLNNDSFVYEPDVIYNYAYYRLFYNSSTLNDTSDLALPATTLSIQCYAYMFYGCSNLTTAPALPATTLAQRCYHRMFYGCSNLTTAPALPATTLAQDCYYQTFYQCTSLTTAPALPATTLADACYEYMFDGCTSLTTTPVLPATTLADYCYRFMFRGCTSLTTAPALPATTLAGQCYAGMFDGCTSLTNAPALPATTLANNCYAGMFRDCTSLTNAPALPATTLATSCYSNMFIRCTSLTTAPALPATTLAKECYDLMFYGCSNLTTAPALPATTLAKECYIGMFRGCTSLNYINCLATNISASNCTTFWTEGVAATGTFVKASSMSSWSTGTSGIPSGWTVQNV